MNKTLLSAALAAACILPQIAAAQSAPASPHTLTGNLGFVTDYRFRGISQTFEQPAIQGGVDYSHASGFYVGTWASNVYGGASAQPLGVAYFNGSMEWDFYGGFKFEVAKDLMLDVGLLYYWYPGAKWANPGKDKYDNTELYIGASYKWLSAKYSHALSDYFGIKSNTVGFGAFPGTGGCGVGSDGLTPTSNCANSNDGSKNSYYFEVNANYPLSDKLTLSGHVGNLTVKNYGAFDYTDWKLGLSYDLNGWTLGAAYVDTDAKEDVYRTAKIEGGPSLNVKETSKGTLVLSIGKTF
ncbi:MAG: hypothetical protein AMXMBFR6_06320 [Betaproteobacteria bacterium]|nr:hypothetical protein [Rhodocyclaceae bacterium]